MTEFEIERLLHDNSALIAQHSNMCQEIERLRKALRELYLFCQDLNDFRPDSRLGREVREALGLVGHKIPTMDKCRHDVSQDCPACMQDEIDRLRKALEAIKKATLEGRVCDDVAWFDQITTLHDFCDQALGIVGSPAPK